MYYLNKIALFRFLTWEKVYFVVEEDFQDFKTALEVVRNEKEELQEALIQSEEQRLEVAKTLIDFEVND